MKRITITFLILCFTNLSFAKGGIFNRFFKKENIEEIKKENLIKKSNVWNYFRKEEILNFIPVVEGEAIPEYIKLNYISEDNQTMQSFSIQVLPLEKGDRRPNEIMVLEREIEKERIREKIVVMMKYYEKVFSRHLEDIKDDPEKIYLLGNQYFLEKRYEKARDIFSKNIDTIDNLFGAALTNRFLGYDKVAIDYYSEVIERSPNFAECYLGRGISYRNLKRYEKALKDFLEYKSMSDSEEAYSALGNIYLLLKNYDAAKNILVKGRSKYPNSKLIRDLLMKAYGNN